MAKSVFIWTSLHEVLIIPINKPKLILIATVVIDQLYCMYILLLNVPLKVSVGVCEAVKLGLGAFRVTWETLVYVINALKHAHDLRDDKGRMPALVCRQSLHPEMCCVPAFRFQGKKMFSFPCVSTAHYVAAFLLAHIIACSKTPARRKDVELALSSKA